MKMVWMGVALVLLLACESQRRCDVDRNCLGGEQCTMGTCEVIPTGGGGAAATGGGTGSGGASGGGGAMSVCSSCPVGYSCESGGSVCLRRIGAIAIDGPLPNARFNQASVSVTAHLTTNGTAVLPDELQVFVDDSPSGTAARAGTGYSVALTNLAEGTHALRLSVQLFDALLSSPEVSFTIDTTRPHLTLATALPAADFKRDDLYKLALQTSEALTPGTVVTLGDTRMDQAIGACVGDAGCWTLDMSLPPLNSLEGNLTILVNASDAVGNSTTFDAGTIHVTRIRWDVQPNAEEIRATPAIGRDGTIFYGTRSTGTAGSLVALNPTTGAQTSSSVVGAVISVATAVSTADAGLVYFTANDSSGGGRGLVGARNTDLTTAGLPNTEARAGATAQTFSALALVAKTGNEVGAIASFNYIGTGTTGGRVVVYSPDSAPEGVNASAAALTSFDFAPVPNPANVAHNIIINNGTALMPTRQVGAGMSLVVVTGPEATPTAGGTTSIENNDCCLAGQAAFGNGGTLIGGLTAGARNLYTFNPNRAAGTLGVIPAPDNGLPATVSSSRAFVGRGNDLVSFNPSSLSLSGTALKSGAGVIRTSPVLGAARPSQRSLGYAVTETGQLIVFDQDSTTTDSAHDFGAIFSTGGTVFAHPNLDCNRRAGAATSTTGILYVTNTSGHVAAIIVDSPQLSRTAAWPRYQRTAGNAGNTDTRFPLNPGCPGN